MLALDHEGALARTGSAQAARRATRCQAAEIDALITTRTEPFEAYAELGLHQAVNEDLEVVRREIFEVVLRQVIARLRRQQGTSNPESLRRLATQLGLREDAGAMWFAYVDESFNAKRHWVIALLVEHERVNDLSAVLRQIVETAAHKYEVPDNAELHGYDVFHGVEDWQPMKEAVRARIGIYRAVFDALVEADCWIILRGVAKPGLIKRYTKPDHPHRVTMTHLIEQIDGFCKGTRGGNDHAVIVADEHHETQSQLLRDLVIYQELGTWGYLAKKIDRVVDTIHFVNSETNPLVQGADMIGFLARRSKTHKEPDPRSAKAIAQLMEIIEPRVHHDHCWYP